MDYYVPDMLANIKILNQYKIIHEDFVDLELPLTKTPTKHLIDDFTWIHRLGDTSREGMVCCEGILLVLVNEKPGGDWKRVPETSEMQFLS